jgi:hypothetical protein
MFIFEWFVPLTLFGGLVFLGGLFATGALIALFKLTDGVVDAVFDEIEAFVSRWKGSA